MSTGYFKAVKYHGTRAVDERVWFFDSDLRSQCAALTSATAFHKENFYWRLSAFNRPEWVDSVSEVYEGIGILVDEDVEPAEVEAVAA